MTNNTRKYNKFIKKTRRKLSGGEIPLQEQPPSNINNYIKHIIYINLDKRTNRNETITKQLTVFNKKKIHRLSAVNNLNNKVVACATR